jgi:heat-inducible transcriptional repressor
MIHELNDRSREILRQIVESYVQTGEPVGSRTLSRRLSHPLSPATIRNVMQDLEESGLLYAPHTSAGRLPTDAGLRLFVNGLLQVGQLTQDERESIEGQCAVAGRALPDVLGEATNVLSGLSRCAGVVVAPKSDRRLRHIEFVNIGPGRALVVMVSDNGMVENRVIDLPAGLPISALTEATNYLNARIAGRSLEDARGAVEREMAEQRAQIDELTGRLVAAGLATWAGSGQDGMLIVRGHSNLLGEVTALEDLERVRRLFHALETKQGLLQLLDATQIGEGVQIFIGAENGLFGLAGCSMVVAPFVNGQERIVGAIGVIGPTRLNYARIVPLVDYTAKVVGRLLG